MITQEAWDGVAFLVDHYARVAPEDFVVVAYTAQACEAAAWVAYELDSRQVATARVAMAPVSDAGFADRFADALPAPEAVAGRVVVMTFECDTMSHTRQLHDGLARFQKDRCAILRIMSAYEELFSCAVKVGPEELHARNATVLRRCTTARNLHVTSPGGTDLSIRLNNDRFRWISNRGALHPGGTVVLPAGEVATYPDSVEGTLVADFALHINTVTDIDTRLDRHPVTVRIEDGCIADFSCDDPGTMTFLEGCFVEPRTRRVGELGFGTNPRVVDPIARNSHINERRPGVHIGFGQHNQSGILPYNCDQHLDLIARGAVIRADRDARPLDLERLVPSARNHPLWAQEEDVFSPDAAVPDVDCCGLE